MLKDKKIVRRLALVLCLSLLVGLVPAGILSVPFTVSAAPDAANVLVNGDFEQGAAGWKSAQVSENAGRTGSAMLMSSAVKGKDIELEAANRVPVTPGESYKITLYAKRDASDATDASLTGYAIWYDAAGNLNEPAGTNVNGSNQLWCKTFGIKPAGTDWELVEFDVVVPRGAATMGIRFYAANAFVGMIYIDDVALTKTGDAPEVPEGEEPKNVIYSDDFEGNILEGWDRNHTNVMTWIPDPGYKESHVIDGSRVLLMQSYNAKDAGQVATSKPIAITGGETYTLNYSIIEHWAYVGSSAGNADVKMIYTDAAGKVLATVTDYASCPAGANAKNWIAREVVAAAPANAAYLKIEFNTHADATSGVLYLVDALTVSAGGNAPAPTDPVATTPSTPVETTPTAPSSPAISGSIVNGGFENEFEGWNAQNDIMSITTDDKINGDAALKFAVTEPQRGRFVKQVISVIPGKTYILSAWVKVLEGKGGYIGIYGLDGANDAVGFGGLTVGEWTKVSLTVTIPHKFSAAEVEYGTNSNQVVTFLLDDIDLVETDAPIAPTEPEITVPTEPEGEKIYEEKFENAFNPEGAASTVRVPVGWTASVHSAAIGNATYDKYDGTMNLCVQDAKDKWIKSPLIEVKEGYEYTATYVEHKYQPTKKGAGGYAKIVFIDKDGNFLKEYSVEVGQAKIWEQGIILSKAPAGATHMYVEFGLQAPSGEPTYSVDDLAVYAVEASLDDAEPTMPTEPEATVDPMKPIDEKFENPIEGDLNAGPVDWFSNDDSVDAFGTMISLVNNELRLDGNYLRLGKTGTWSITSPEFPVQIGYAYNIKYMARKLVDNTNFNGVVEIVFVNTRGKIVETKTAVAGKTFGSWAEETFSAVAPIGAYKAYVVLRVENTDRKVNADFAVDNFTVTRADEPSFEYDQEATEPIIYNAVLEDTFTESYRPGGAASTVRVPVGWTSSIPNSAAIGVGTYDKHEGTATLFIQNKGDKFCRSDVHPAKAGYNYLVSFVEKKYQPHIAAEGGYMRIAFLDAAGNLISIFEEKAGFSKTWTDMEYEFTAPAGTAGYFIEFGLASCSGGDPTYGVDDLVVYESEAKVSDGTGDSGNSGSGNNGGSGNVNPDNTDTGDHTALMTVSTILVAVVAMAVLVLKKRRFF